MKKSLILLLVCAMAFGSMACGKKETTKEKKSKSDKKAEDVEDEDEDDEKDKDSDKDAEEEDAGFEFKESGETIVFTVTADFTLEQDSWMGIVPAGKDYKKEVDADEVDIYYVYVYNFEKKASENYKFEFVVEDLKGLEDGSYSIVLCDTDADTGKVLAQFPVELKGGKLTPDFSKTKVN